MARSVLILHGVIIDDRALAAAGPLKPARGPSITWTTHPPDDGDEY